MSKVTSVIHNKEKWIERFARFGIIAKGIVYCLVGVLTVLAALGLRKSKGTKTEALSVIDAQPLGQVLLLIIAIGLAGYVTWRMFQAVYDIDNKGKDPQALLIRTGYAINALIYLALGIYAVQLVLAGQGSGEGDSRQLLVTKVLSYPAGEWIVGISALVIIISGARQIYKALSGKFMDNIRVTRAAYHPIYKKAGVVGYISRGIVLIIIGYFLIRAALHSSMQEAPDTEGAFDFLQHTLGTTLMVIVAGGLTAYGIFMFVKARHQHIDLNF